MWQSAMGKRNARRVASHFVLSIAPRVSCAGRRLAHEGNLRRLLRFQRHARINCNHYSCLHMPTTGVSYGSGGLGRPPGGCVPEGTEAVSTEAPPPIGL